MLHSALDGWVKVRLEEKERQVHAQQEKMIITLAKARDEVRKVSLIKTRAVCACTNIPFVFFFSLWYAGCDPVSQVAD